MGFGHQEMHRSCLQDMGEVCAWQSVSAELQMFEVEAVPRTSGRVPEQLYPCPSTALWAHRAAGSVGLYLLHGQEGIWVTQPQLKPHP